MAYKDPKKLKAYSKAYYETHKNDKLKIYREVHKENIKARNKTYREEHKEELKAYLKVYRETHKEQRKAYYETHRDAIRTNRT